MLEYAQKFRHNRFRFTYIWESDGENVPSSTTSLKQRFHQRTPMIWICQPFSIMNYFQAKSLGSDGQREVSYAHQHSRNCKDRSHYIDKYRIMELATKFHR